MSVAKLGDKRRTSHIKSLTSAETCTVYCNLFVKYVSSNVSECNISSPNCKSEKHALHSGPINEHVCDMSSCQSYRTLKGICGLEILHFNAPSLYPKIDELCFIALDLKLDCISVNETWLNHTFTDASVNVPNYSLFRKDRICSSHGGVALYIRSSLNPEIVDHNFLSECVAVKIKLKNCAITLVSMYRAPNSLVSYHENIILDLEYIFSLGTDIILAGDFNYDLSKGNHNKVTEIENLYLLTQIIGQPTRVISSSNTIIDHIYISNHISPLSSGVVPISISDHYPVYVVLSLQKPSVNNHKSISKWSFKHFSYNSFVHDILYLNTVYDIPV